MSISTVTGKTCPLPQLSIRFCGSVTRKTGVFAKQQRFYLLKENVLAVGLQHDVRSVLHVRCLKCFTSGILYHIHHLISAYTSRLWWTHSTWGCWSITRGESSCGALCLAWVSPQKTPAAHQQVTTLVYAPHLISDTASSEPLYQLMCVSHCFSSATAWRGTDSGLFWLRRHNLSFRSAAPPNPASVRGPVSHRAESHRVCCNHK